MAPPPHAARFAPGGDLRPRRAVIYTGCTVIYTCIYTCFTRPRICARFTPEEAAGWRLAAELGVFCSCFTPGAL